MQIVDEGHARAFRIQKQGLPDAIIWNPWIEKAKGMADFGDDEYKVRYYRSSRHFFAVRCRLWSMRTGSFPWLMESLYVQEMVCLEPAVASSGPVKLEPGGTWSASVLFSLVAV